MLHLNVDDNCIRLSLFYMYPHTPTYVTDCEGTEYRMWENVSWKEEDHIINRILRLDGSGEKMTKKIQEVFS